MNDLKSRRDVFRFSAHKLHVYYQWILKSNCGYFSVRENVIIAFVLMNGSTLAHMMFV